MPGIENFIELEPNSLNKELVLFMEQTLPSFQASQEFIDILEHKKNENQHSLSFCVFMTNECHSKFYFARENAQKGSSVIDIGVYRGSVLIFTIEAKLLPTPKGSKKKLRDEHEYVYGKGAGIQRFKEESHGLDNGGNLLLENGLIAFIKNGDFAQWFKKVNEWILSAAWGEQEQLEEISFDSIGKLRSKHIRINNSQVILYHFWIDVSTT